METRKKVIILLGIGIVGTLIFIVANSASKNKKEEAFSDETNSSSSAENSNIALKEARFKDTATPVDKSLRFEDTIAASQEAKQKAFETTGIPIDKSIRFGETVDSKTDRF